MAGVVDFLYGSGAVDVCNLQFDSTCHIFGFTHEEGNLEISRFHRIAFRAEVHCDALAQGCFILMQFPVYEVVGAGEANLPFQLSLPAYTLTDLITSHAVSGILRVS